MTIDELRAMIETTVRPDCACGRPAEYILHKHALNGCNNAGRPGYCISPDGAVVDLVCMPCAATEVVRLRCDVERRSRALGMYAPDAVMSCSGCGRPITQVSDLIEVEAL